MAMIQPAPLPDPGDRRSGVERRAKVLPFSTERRKQDRRDGLDRRGGDLSTDTHLRVALEHLIRAADDPTLDDISLRLVDNAVLRIWAALEAIGEK